MPNSLQGNWRMDDKWLRHGSRQHGNKSTTTMQLLLLLLKKKREKMANNAPLKRHNAGSTHTHTAASPATAAALLLLLGWLHCSVAMAKRWRQWRRRLHWGIDARWQTGKTASLKSMCVRAVCVCVCMGITFSDRNQACFQANCPLFTF